ncbi:MAG: lipB [Gammaproteobacteria bacterium]|jgi:lipoyl(octanoyl) transferase|nr:lipB [Gammaproteobacteria bacterium]
MIANQVIIRMLGLKDYLSAWQAMRQFTDARNENTVDEIWLLEHPPVFTQGQNGKPEHLLSPHNIPVIRTDRGGQVTYHGPGQLIIYTLIDLKRKKFHVRNIINLLERSIMQLLASYHIQAKTKCEAPGVYVEDKKICSIGLRIRRGCSFHGLALNINMDLNPFLSIHPCGFPQLKMTQMIELNKTADSLVIGKKLIEHLTTNLGYTSHLIL